MLFFFAERLGSVALLALIVVTQLPLSWFIELFGISINNFRDDLIIDAFEKSVLSETKPAES